ncbi:hypothetical protein ACVDFE_02135 [Lentzea chajnantorensis]
MRDTTVPVHPTLIDPATGEPLEALAVIGGRPVWPVLGGSGEDEDDDQDDDEGQEPDDDADDDQDDDAKSGKGKRAVRKKNQENQSLRRRLQEAEEKAKQWDSHVAKSKTKEEQDAEKLTEAERLASTSQSELIRLRVALRKGLTEKQAARLVGETEEDLEADADEFLAELGGDGKSDKDDRTEKVKNRPRTRLKGGGRPDEEPDETDPRKLAAKVARRGGGRGF